MPIFDGKFDNEPWSKQLLYAYCNSIDYYETDEPNFLKVLQIHKEELDESHNEEGKDNHYIILKQELETLLTERNLDEIEEVMVKSENQKDFYSEEYIKSLLEANVLKKEEVPSISEFLKDLKKLNVKFLERIYHEIYKDDPTFKAELVQTPVEELLKMHF